MIRLDSVTKRFPNGFVAVHTLSIEVREGETCVLIGPSGCGKTTTLKMINRLIEPTSGHIYLDDEDVTRADPVELRRRMGYVIQQVGLFPHQTVGTNVGTVPRLLGWKHDRIARRVDELLTLVGLDPGDFRDRYPAQLSGGQRQRVGVARALAADPPVLLMDEPFGAIDPVTRVRLQDEFLGLQAELRKTVVFVTHDIEEAVKMGDRIAILNVGGILAQYDTPAEVLGSPATPFVADFVGTDRGLKRLRVTAIEPTVLEHPPTLLPTSSLAEARAAIDRSGGDWVAVVDPDGRLLGHVPKADAGGEGPVGPHVERLEAWVAIDAPLEEALSAMLLTDVGWVAVLDGDRFLGVLTPESVYRTLRRSLDTADATSTLSGAT
ncbi:MAG TPA: betaine/proline/choline family ABC transporter ATP-binding protein [Acidimicrobiia bacterium]|jgi:osmoprotectant transport system ATP-binding protein|nr:betaine/proline/choline family ABC transporter ATP-binding protein [Acidimicrobiia bacterium]